jgi:hypothetical protein
MTKQKPNSLEEVVDRLKRLDVNDDGQLVAMLETWRRLSDVYFVTVFDETTLESYRAFQGAQPSLAVLEPVPEDPSQTFITRTRDNGDKLYWYDRGCGHWLFQPGSASVFPRAIAEDMLEYYINRGGRVRIEPTHSRTWCFYHTKDEAIEAVKRNAGDMQELLYMYAVVEPYGPNSFSLTDDQTVWFKWEYSEEEANAPLNHRDRGKWVQCPRPPETKNIVNFAIG